MALHHHYTRIALSLANLALLRLLESNQMTLEMLAEDLSSVVKETTMLPIYRHALILDYLFLHQTSDNAIEDFGIIIDELTVLINELSKKLEDKAKVTAIHLMLPNTVIIETLGEPIGGPMKILARPRLKRKPSCLSLLSALNKTATGS